MAAPCSGPRLEGVEGLANWETHLEQMFSRLDSAPKGSKLRHGVGRGRADGCGGPMAG